MFSKHFKITILASAMALSLVGCGADSGETKGNQITSAEPVVEKALEQNPVAESAQVAQEYKEGVHYTKLESAFERPANSVMELFSFTCSHCKRAEYELMTDWKKDSSIDFEVEHAVFPLFKGLERKLVWDSEAKIFFALKQAGRTDLMKAFFEKRQSNPQFNDSHIVEFISENGLDEKAFFENLRSAGANKYVQEMALKSTQTGSTSVPTFVVSGKYLINLRSIQGFSDVKSISEFLIKEQP